MAWLKWCFCLQGANLTRAPRDTSTAATVPKDARPQVQQKTAQGNGKASAKTADVLRYSAHHAPRGACICHVVRPQAAALAFLSVALSCTMGDVRKVTHVDAINKQARVCPGYPSTGSAVGITKGRQCMWGQLYATSCYILLHLGALLHVTRSCSNKPA